MKRIASLFAALILFSAAADAGIVHRTTIPVSKGILRYSDNGFTTERDFKPNAYSAGRPLQRNMVKTIYKKDKKTPQYKEKQISNIVSTNNVYFNRISDVERTLYGTSYDNQNVNTRLNRLEYSVFSRTYPTMSYEQRVNNLIMNYNNNVIPKNISSRDLTGLEEKVFNRSYTNETQQSRVSRLEQEVFGASQSGDLADRLAMLRQATMRYQPQINSYPYCTPVVQSGSNWRNALGALGNLMMINGGMPTGLTPQIDPNYMDYMDPGYSRQVRSNRGWAVNNNQTGSGSRVTILD